MVKNNKGITLVALMVTVIVLLIITTAGISTTLDRFELNDYKKMKSDLELLEDKVSDYYLKYEGLPILRQGSSLAYASSGQADQDMEEVTSKPVEFEYIEYLNKLTNTNQEPATNANDNDIYYIIDLEALGNITLNYGKGFKKGKNVLTETKDNDAQLIVETIEDDIYIINEQSHTIYYVKGVEIDGITYHYIKQDEQIFDDVPPTAPEINVVLGTENQGIYSNKIILEIVPGKEKITQVRETSYIVTKNDNEIIRENINDTKQIELNDFGRYKIVAYTTDTGENSSNETVYEFEIKKIYYRKKNGEDAQGYLLSDYENTEVWDLYDNKLIVPAGFKITYDSKNITEGTVIEDESGNQFVWIATGTIYQNEEKTESKTIKLGRYENFKEVSGGGYNPTQEATACAESKIINKKWTEDTNDNHKSEAKNAIAKNIKDFCEKANSNGGYYIGRYEARVENYDPNNINTSNGSGGTGYKAIAGKELKLVSKADSRVWNYVTQPKASSLCQSMYQNKKFESDLVNSYAWDTAIIFLQTFGENSNYANQISINQGKIATNGTSGTNYSGKIDKICNIYDMASNCLELTTETSNDFSTPCCRRGGDYNNWTNFNTKNREVISTSYTIMAISFRPIIYLDKD